MVNKMIMKRCDYQLYKFMKQQGDEKLSKGKNKSMKPNW